MSYNNRVYDTSISRLVAWRTPAPDPTGVSYPGPGTFGIDTSGYSITYSPDDAAVFTSPPYVAVSADGTLTNERVLTVGSGLGITDAGPGSTLTVAISTNGVADTMLRQSSGLSLLGRAANSGGNVGDITAGSDLDFLRRNGTAIGFGTHPTVEQLKLGVPASTTQTIASGTSATISAGVRTVLLNTGSGNFNLTMRALNDGDEILLLKTSTDANTITLVRAGSETINNQASNLLLPGSSSKAGYVAFVIRVVSSTAVVVA